MAFAADPSSSAPPYPRSAASSTVQLWRPAKEVLQFLTECALPAPAMPLLECGSASLGSDSGSDGCPTPSRIPKRPPPTRWEPPAQMKLSHLPLAVHEDHGEVDRIDLSAGTPISHDQSFSDSNGKIGRSGCDNGSQLMMDRADTLRASSTTASSSVKEPSLGLSKDQRACEGSAVESKPQESDCVSGPSKKIKSDGSTATGEGVGDLKEGEKESKLTGVSVEMGESNDAAESGKDLPEPLDLLMNAIQVASGSSSAKPSDGDEKKVETEKVVQQKLAYFVHGFVPIVQKRIRRRAKSSYQKQKESVQKELKEKTVVISKPVSVAPATFLKKQSPERVKFIVKHGKQPVPQERSLESILYGDSGPPMRTAAPPIRTGNGATKRGRTHMTVLQEVPSQYPDKVVSGSANYKRSRSKSFKCVNKIWTFA